MFDKIKKRKKLVKSNVLSKMETFFKLGSLFLKHRNLSYIEYFLRNLIFPQKLKFSSKVESFVKKK